MKKTDKVFIIDTNIILNDHSAPFTFKNSYVIIPQIVVQELDKKKNYIENQSVAFNARAFSRRIRKLMKEQDTCELVSGSTTVIIQSANKKQLDKDIKNLGLDPAKGDSQIVATAWRLHQDGYQVTVVTSDINMWLSCHSLGINVEDYEVNKASQSDSLYTGVKVLQLESSELVENIYGGKDQKISEEDFPGLYPNQILVIKSSSKTSLLAAFEGYNKPLRRIKDMKKMQFSGVKPLNKEQCFAFDLLLNDKIQCVTLVGKAGTGKSIVTLSYAVDSLNDKKYEKIIVLKPIIPVGKDLGFLPGTLSEKLEPWTESIMDSLDVIFKNEDPIYEKDGMKFKEKSYKQLLDSGLIQFQPLTFMRGRSIRNTLIILDESQNVSNHEMKTLLTRVGEGSKVICIGDVEQIDAAWLTQQNNGLSYLIERGKDSELIGHITLIKSLRGSLADWASSNL